MGRSGHRASVIVAALLAGAALVVAPGAITAGGDTILTTAGNGTRASAGDGVQALVAALDFREASTSRRTGATSGRSHGRTESAT